MHRVFVRRRAAGTTPLGGTREESRAGATVMLARYRLADVAAPNRRHTPRLAPLGCHVHFPLSLEGTALKLIIVLLISHG